MTWGPLQIIQDHLPISRSLISNLNSINNLNSPLSCKVTQVWVLGMGTSLEGHHSADHRLLLISFFPPTWQILSENGIFLVNSISKKVLTFCWGFFLPGVPGSIFYGCFCVYCLWVLFPATGSHE